jgi:hypothetical protein
MQDYFKTAEYYLEHIWFDYLGGRYEGRGLLTWKPKKGFHLEAFLDRSGAPLPKRIEIGKFSIVSGYTIRLKPFQYAWALAPDVPLIDRNDLIEEQRLSLNFNRVIFSTYRRENKAHPYFTGSALYRTGKGLI